MLAKVLEIGFTFIFGNGPWKKGATLDVESYIAELSKSIGSVAEKARILLGSISVSPHDIEYVNRRERSLQAGFSTLEGVNAICDLRSVFRASPSPDPSDSHLANIKDLLGFEPVVFVNLQIADGTGRKEACALQITQNQLKQILKTLQQASIQLEVINELKANFLSQGDKK